MRSSALVRTLAAAVLFHAWTLAAADDADQWPSRTTTIVVGYPAGSGMDTTARFVAEHLRQRTGKSFIVENRPGVLGRVGAAYVAKAKPDGYTVLLHPASLVTYPFLFKEVGFNPVEDLAAVTTITKVYYVLVVNSSHVPVNSVAELTAYIKAHPGATAYGSGAANPEIAGFLYGRLEGLDAVKVRYAGLPPAMNDLLAGRIQYMFADSTLAMAQVRGGRVRSLAVAANQRMLTWPEVPTMAEAGVKGFDDLSSWMAAFVPTGTSIAIRESLSKMLNAVMASDEGKAQLPKFAMDPFPGSPQKSQEFVASELRRYAVLTKSAGITPQ
jgi:tripartite-type tricarboxylate transporter receptor subunit TctC